MNIAIVKSEFNAAITDSLCAEALKTLEEHGVSAASTFVVSVPGAFEIPSAAQEVARRNCYDAIICLGAVIRGETPHFDYICQEVARGINQVALTYFIPVIFGVLTTDTYEQAEARSSHMVGHKGREAAECALQMIRVFSSIRQQEVR